MALMIFLFLLLPSLAFAETLSPTSLCHDTNEPSYCMSLLPPQSATLHDTCHFSLHHSLLRTREFLNHLDQILQYSSSLSSIVIAGLEDCRMLADLNVDFLSSSLQTINNKGVFLSDTKVESVQTMLSAVLTNHETCLEGLQDSDGSLPPSLLRRIPFSLFDSKKLYGVSLSLFVKSWVHMSKPKFELPRHQPPQMQSVFQNGHLALAMSNRTRAIFEAASGRKLDSTSAATNMAFVRDIVTVSKNGKGNFTNISDAISAAPNKTSSSEGYFLIYVSAGVYEEYIFINKKKTYLMMIGDGINKTIITGNRSNGDGHYKTFNTATFAVHGKGFVGVNITFRNTAGLQMHQAVAARNSANLSVFYSCSFEGYQDTLYAHSMKQFYKDCDIYGTVDFICGNAAAVFQNCNIHVRKPNHFNVITAQSRAMYYQNTGFSMDKCTITAAEDLLGAKTYLGRPWKSLSRTVYMDTFMDSIIDEAGWHVWDHDNESSLNSLYYAEYNNSGPGSNTSHRVTWNGYHIVNYSIAADFDVSKFLQGDYWLPQTGVPYAGHLN